MKDGIIMATDGACSGNPGLMEYQGVVVKSKEVLFHVKPNSLGKGTNNQAEYLALAHAIKLLVNENINGTVYCDSQAAMAWIRKKKVNTNPYSEKISKMLFNAERYIEGLNIESATKNSIVFKDKGNAITIKKWDTKRKGEIPADFGRK